MNVELRANSSRSEGAYKLTTALMADPFLPSAAIAAKLWPPADSPTSAILPGSPLNSGACCLNVADRLLDVFYSGAENRQVFRQPVGDREADKSPFDQRLEQRLDIPPAVAGHASPPPWTTIAGWESGRSPRSRNASNRRLSPPARPYSISPRTSRASVSLGIIFWRFVLNLQTLR